MDWFFTGAICSTVIINNHHNSFSTTPTGTQKQKAILWWWMWVTGREVVGLLEIVHDGLSVKKIGIKKILLKVDVNWP